MRPAKTEKVRIKDVQRNAVESDGLYRLLPSVNDLLLTASLRHLDSQHGHNRVVEAVRRCLDRTRSEIMQGLHVVASLKQLIDELPARVSEELRKDSKCSLRRVINATGVLLHTNLGRAPLSRMALDHMLDIAAGYSNLEFDLERGERGKRDVHVESLLLGLVSEAAPKRLAETHRAIIVNNCAAATFLALHALARGKQVLVSRAELVEIGGGFRIPEILEESGAVLREVGTTNRTRAADYERAITSETGLILRVHQSNFAMEGFVERPNLEKLVALGRRSGIGVFEDQGTGLVETLDPYGVRGEVSFADSVAQGCDLVAASGDKLLGGPQCGILVGRKELVDRIRISPLYRTFRADKLNYAALEATLMQYRDGDAEAVPVIQMLRTPESAIRQRCEQIAEAVQAGELAAGVIQAESVIGGGTTPKSRLASHAVALRHARLDASTLLTALRRFDPPIIGRIEDGQVLLDLRTVEPEFDELLVHSLKQDLAAFAQAAGESH